MCSTLPGGVFCIGEIHDLVDWVVDTEGACVCVCTRVCMCVSIKNVDHPSPTGEEQHIQNTIELRLF
jgi:hypothetical protein